MKDYVITIDAGTTNTRAVLWNSARTAVASERRDVGVRNTAIDGNNSKLKQAVRDCLECLLAAGGITYDDVKTVIASGMITSNVGLVEIPHLVVPAGLDELGAAAARGVPVPDVSPLPIHFIPGVKNSAGPVALEELEAMDIMRGEETEACAVVERLGRGRPLLLVLPGSHTKFVSIDASGRITGCLTTIAGELLASITNHTIIADAVKRSFVDEADYDVETVLLGCRVAMKTGLARACFSARILNQFVDKDPKRAANFILGAVLSSDVAALKNSSALRPGDGAAVVSAGKNPFRSALADILRADGGFAEVLEFAPEVGAPLSALGALAIAERGGIL